MTRRNTMASDKVVTITRENFEQEVIKSDTPVLVDFWASWCGPCMAIGPIIDEIANDYDGKLKVGKLNVDEQGELAKKYRVMSIPTIMIFKNGEVAERVVGARAKSEFAGLIDSHL
jgi:thioredoxin 1